MRGVNFFLSKVSMFQLRTGMLRSKSSFVAVHTQSIMNAFRIPVLPPSDEGIPWTAAVHQACRLLDAAVGHALRALRQESDSVRLRFH